MQALAAELEAIYERSGARLYACALAVTASGSLAEDAVHNAFQRTLKLERRPKHLDAYLFRSVRNAAIDLMRKEGRLTPLEPDMIFECSATQETHVDRAEMLDRVSAGLANLAANERETIMEHLIAELTFREIAELRDRSMGTVTSWYRRGLKKLRDSLENEDGTL